MDNDVLNLLKELTAPFRETRVRWAVTKFCKENKIPTYQDNFGNLWVNAEKAEDLQDTNLVLIAHMDHPGILIHEFFTMGDGSVYAFGDWLGGGPKNIKDAKLLVFSTNENKPKMDLSGLVSKYTIKGERPKKVVIKVDTDKDVKFLNNMAPWGACIVFDEIIEDGFKKEDDTWIVRSADDLFLLCALLQVAKDRKIPKSVKFLFSRSEEKGELGSYFAAADTPLSHNTKIISIDITDTKSEKNLGKGLIVKQEDEKNMHSKELVSFLIELAEKEYKEQGFEYKVVKRHEKGATDSTAFGELGFDIASIEIPLWNYHNKGPKLMPAPEIIYDKDLKALLAYINILIDQF